MQRLTVVFWMLCVCLMRADDDEWIRVDISVPHQGYSSNSDETSAKPEQSTTTLETITVEPPITTTHEITSDLPKKEKLKGDNINRKNESENSIALTPSEMETLVSVHKRLFLESQNDHSIRGKMQFLESLKDNILQELYLRINRAFGGPRTTLRQARGDKGVEFPSNETALLTISFLLFAVYLIKLVQQLIRKLQGQNDSNANLVLVNTGKRRRRSIPDLLTTARVLKLMDDFQIHYKIND